MSIASQYVRGRALVEGLTLPYTTVKSKGKNLYLDQVIEYETEVA